MTRLQSLLNSPEALEPHEITDLRNWLDALKLDCDMFGETGQDVERMAVIHARIQIEEARERQP